MNGGFLGVVATLVVSAALLSELADASGKSHASGRRKTSSRSGGKSGGASGGSSLFGGGSSGSSAAYEPALAALEKSVKLRYNLNEASDADVKAVVAEYKKGKPAPTRNEHKPVDDENNSIIWKGLNHALFYRNVVAFACKKCNNKNAKLCNSSSNKPLVHELEAIQFADFINTNHGNETVMNEFFENWVRSSISASDGLKDSHFHDLYKKLGHMPSSEHYYVYAMKALVPLAEEFSFINAFNRVAENAVQTRYYDAIKALLDNGNDSILGIWYDQPTLKKLYEGLPDYIKRRIDATALDQHVPLIAVNVLDIINEYTTDPTMKSQLEERLRSDESRQEVEALVVAYKSAENPNMWEGYVGELNRLQDRKMLALLKNSNYRVFVDTLERWFNGQRNNRGLLVEHPPPEVFMTHLYTIVRQPKYCKKLVIALQFRAQVQEVKADAAAHAAGELLDASKGVDTSKWTVPQAKVFALIHRYLRYQQERNSPIVTGVSADLQMYTDDKLEPEDDDKKKALAPLLKETKKKLAKEVVEALEKELPKFVLSDDLIKNLGFIYLKYRADSVYEADVKAIKTANKIGDDVENAPKPKFQFKLQSMVPGSDGSFSDSDIAAEKTNFPIVDGLLRYVGTLVDGSQKRKLDKVQKQLPLLTNCALVIAMNNHVGNVNMTFDYPTNPHFQLVWDSFSSRYGQFDESVFLQILGEFTEKRRFPDEYGLKLGQSAPPAAGQTATLSHRRKTNTNTQSVFGSGTSKRRPSTAGAGASKARRTSTASKTANTGSSGSPATGKRTSKKGVSSKRGTGH